MAFPCNILSSALLMMAAFNLNSAGNTCTPEEISQENLQKLGIANNDLALGLYRRLAANSSENLVFSPLSISTAFGMLFYGARGDTAEELRIALGYQTAELPDELVHATFSRFLKEVLKNDNPSSGYVLNSANAIVIDKQLQLLSDYKNQVQDLYQASIQEVDFVHDSSKAVGDINHWVKAKTNGKIEKLLETVDKTTMLVLLNAVYFKGTWRILFDEKKTRPELFYNDGLESSAKEVPMMHMSPRLRYGELDDIQVLELPYKGEAITMLLLLPHERDGLADLENRLTLDDLFTIQQQMFDNKVNISLPKFKIEFSKDLSQDIEGLGASQVFQPEADLSGLTPSQDVSVSQVLHKAVIEVNEKGSEAAAVTGIISNRMRPIFDTVAQFKADHPFMFVILEKGSKSNMILFMGRVNNL